MAKKLSDDPRVEDNFRRYSGKHDPRARHGWYRGDTCNFAPRRGQLDSSRDPAREFVLKGWLPEEKFLSKQTPIIAFGSCFACHITNYLKERGYAIAGDGCGMSAGSGRRRKNTIQLNAGVNNTFAVRDVFEHVYDGKVFQEETWHDADGEVIAKTWDFRDAAIEIFKRADLFILTLGLSEIWRNKNTGEVFWRSVPEAAFNPDVHEFSVSTVAENKANIQYVYDKILEHKPEAKVLFTVSPVSLVATFRPVSCITANSVSKAILRAAVDEVYRENDGDNNPHLYYWPSYEMVEKLYPDPYRPDGDTRHVRKEVSDQIMREFERAYSVDYVNGQR